MWWDWEDPRLKGPEPDPRLHVLVEGLLLNPLIIGLGAFILVAVPYFGVRIGKRIVRALRHQCLHCGYTIRTPSPICPECGNLIDSRTPPEADASAHT